MKNLGTIIKKGDLSAKERALIYISSQIEKDKTGNEVLTARDIEAIKDPKAFTSNEYINTYNNYVKSWTSVFMLNIELQHSYAMLVLLYNHLRDLCLFTAKDIADTYLIDSCISQLDHKEYYTMAILKGLGKENKTLNELKMKNGIKDVELVGSASESLSKALSEFRLVYSAILANREILYKVSQKLGIDVAYKANQFYEFVRKKADRYDSAIDFMLIDFSRAKAGDLDNSPKDKVFKNREGIYLDLDRVSMDEELFNLNIPIFEDLFGKRFWES
jgi:hypothetical protein